jgi:hypothetical protein
MTLDLTEEETEALARLLSRTIDDDHYPLSPRIQTLKAILGKIRPEPMREPPPPQRHTSRRASGLEDGVEVRVGQPIHLATDPRP